MIMSKFNTPKNIIKCAQNIGCIRCTKFEYEGIKTAGVTDYTNQHFEWIKCSPTALKIFIKCAQNTRCTCSMYEQSLYKVSKGTKIKNRYN